MPSRCMKARLFFTWSRASVRILFLFGCHVLKDNCCFREFLFAKQKKVSIQLEVLWSKPSELLFAICWSRKLSWHGGDPATHFYAGTLHQSPLLLPLVTPPIPLHNVREREFVEHASMGKEKRVMEKTCN